MRFLIAAAGFIPSCMVEDAIHTFARADGRAGPYLTASAAQTRLPSKPYSSCRPYRGTSERACGENLFRVIYAHVLSRDPSSVRSQIDGL